MISFTWNGTEMPKFMMLETIPSPLRFEQVTSVIDMPDGLPLAYATNAFKSQQISLNISFRIGVWDAEFFGKYSGNTSYRGKTKAQLEAIFSTMTVSQIEELQYISTYNWLCGAGKLTFSNDSDKYYKAVCNSQVVPERISRRLRKIPLQFTVFPFRYNIANNKHLVNAFSPIEGTEKKEIYLTSDGTFPSEPSLKFYVNGDFTFIWDDYNEYKRVEVTIKNVDTSVTVDVPTRRVYDKNGNVILSNVKGNFTDIRLGCPYMLGNDSADSRGQRLIVDNSVTKLEYVRNTRWR